jgi:hypothetical protein
MNDINYRMNCVMFFTAIVANFIIIVESTPHFYRCSDMLML